MPDREPLGRRPDKEGPGGSFDREEIRAFEESRELEEPPPPAPGKRTMTSRLPPGQGPRAVQLLADAQLYLLRGEEEALERLEAASARRDPDAAQPAWFHLGSYLAIAEQSLHDAEAAAASDPSVADVIRDDILAARRLAADLRAEAFALIEEVEPGLADAVRQRGPVGPGHGSPLPPLAAERREGSAGAAMNRATAGAAIEIPHRREMERAFGEAFGSVRAHVGQGAPLAAMNAAAAARGEEVAFASASPSAPLVAHELAHVVQHRRRGSAAPDAVASLAAEPQDSPAEREARRAADAVATGAPMPVIREAPAAAVAAARPDELLRIPEDMKPPPLQGATAVFWLTEFAARLAIAVGRHLEGAAPASGHPRLRWRADPTDIATRVWSEIAPAEGVQSRFAFAQRLPGLVAPIDLLTAIDAARPIDPANSTDGIRRGPLEYVEEAAVLIAREVERAIAASLARVGPRVVAAVDAMPAAEDLCAPRETSILAPAAVVVSHPMDGPVAAGLCAPGVAEVAPTPDGEADRRLDRMARVGSAGLRRVTYTWHDDPALWNWIRVEPVDAAVEEVAASLLGDPARAGELEAAAPFFALPPAVAAELAPERAAKAGAHLVGRDGASAAFRAMHLLAAGAGVSDLAESAAGDEASLAQADRAGGDAAPGRGGSTEPSGPSPDRPAPSPDPQRLADRCHLQLRYLAEHFAAFGAAETLAPAAARLERRRAHLAAASPEERTRFAALFAEQTEVLYEVAGDLERIARRALPRSSRSADGAAPGTIDPIVQRLAAGLLEAAGLSDLPEAARARLAASRQERASAEFDALDAMIADARAHSRAADPLVGPFGPEYLARQNRDLADDIRGREKALAGDILAARRARATGDEDPEETRALRERTRAVQMESRLVAGIAQCSFLAKRLRDERGLVARVTLQEQDLVRASRRLDHLSRAMTDVLFRWQDQHAELFAALDSGTCEEGDPAGAARRAIAQLETELTSLGDADVQAALQAAHDELRDMAMARMAIDIAVMVGLTLVTSGLGTAAAGAARAMGMGRLAVALADIATQSTAMAGLRAALYRDAFVESLGTELITNLAGFAALRGLAHALPELQAGKRLAALKESQGAWKYLAHGAELTLEAATQAGLQFAIAQGESLVRQGRLLDQEELKALAIQGIGMFIGNAVAHRLARPAMERLEVVGAKLGIRLRREAIEALAHDVARTGDPAKTQKLLREDRQLLDAEQDVLRRAASDPHLVEELGGEAALAAARRDAEIEAGRARDLAVEHALHRRLDEDIEGIAFSGPPETVARVLAEAEAAGAKVTSHPASDGRIEHRIESGERTYTVSESTGTERAGPPGNTESETDPIRRNTALREGVAGFRAESSTGVNPPARKQLGTEVRQENPDMPLLAEVNKGEVKTIVRFIFSGTKALNDKVLGRALTDQVAAARDQVFREVFAAHGMKVIDTDYKEITVTTARGPDSVVAEMEAVVAAIDARMTPILQRSAAEAVPYWESELAKEGSRDRAELEDSLENARHYAGHPEEMPFGFQYGLAEIKDGGQVDYPSALAAKMNATRAALMSRVDAARGKGSRRGQVYDEEKFVAFMVEGENIKAELMKSHGNAIRVGKWDIELFDEEGLPGLDALRALRKGQLDPKKLPADQVETARLFQSYYDHLNAFDYMKGFVADDLGKAGERVQRALDVVKRLEEGGAVTEAELADVLDRNASGRIMPRDKTPSERVFYDASLKLEERFILNADIKDMGNNLAREYARKQMEVAQRGASAIPGAALSAEDVIVRFKQRATEKLEALHEQLIEQAIADATRKGNQELVKELLAEQGRGLLFLFGGDEITVSLHPAMKDYVGEFVAEMAKEDVANARVAVVRTGKGAQDGGKKTQGSLQYAMDADSNHKILKGYEEKQRVLEWALKRITDAERRKEGRVMVDALRLRDIYVDVEMDGPSERIVLKQAPEGEPVPATLGDEIARTLARLEQLVR